MDKSIMTMNEAKVYSAGKLFEDNFSAAFSEESGFLSFLSERRDSSWWKTQEAKDIRFVALDDGSQDADDVTSEYEKNGMKDIITDTMENTRLLLKANDECYPVRTCAIRSILDRAKISGNALSKVEKPVLARILNYCLNVSSGDALIRYSEGKVSALHGGDNSDYAILEMPELFGAIADYLNTTFPGCRFDGASYDHSIATAIWELSGQDALLDTYKQALDDHGIPYEDIEPAVRFTTSDIGISGANIYPMLLTGKRESIITLGSPLKLEHKAGATIEKFKSKLPLIYSQYTVAIGNLKRLLDIEIENPVSCMLKVCKRIGVTKKLAFEAAKLFDSQNGNSPCTAHEIYYGISEVIFMMQCNGESGSRIAQMEENVARAFSVRWYDYDIPGDMTW